MRFSSSWLALGFLAATSHAAPLERASVKRQDAGKMVFAHFMVGIMSSRASSAEYDSDMKNAKAAGIDAFALNVGLDSYTDAQLGFAYESAANNDMKVFISFDYNYFATGDSGTVAEKIKTYADKPGQLMYNGKVFVSSFAGDSPGSGKVFDAAAIRAAAGLDLFLVPNYDLYGDRAAAPISGVDGALSWRPWPSNGANRAPDSSANVSTAAVDSDYAALLGDKAYLAAISPWYFTNLPQYSKSWVFPGDLLWYNRWEEILALAPPFIEILTWNDYGESHYIGPVTPHDDDGSGVYTDDIPHQGWLEMAKPYIAAYKSGAKSVSVTEEKIVYWYRPSLKSDDCNLDGSATLQDAVFGVALLATAGPLTVTSGSNTVTIDATAGATAFQVPMAVGKPTFKVNSLSGTGELEIAADCAGTKNQNAFVGVIAGSVQDLPASPASSAAPVSSSAAVASQGPVYNAPAASSAAPSSSTAASPPAQTPAAAPSSSAPAPAPADPTIAPTPTQEPHPNACSVTLTALEQIRPTNCLAAGQAWGGGGDTPACCDGAACCR